MVRVEPLTTPAPQAFTLGMISAHLKPRTTSSDDSESLNESRSLIDDVIPMLFHSDRTGLLCSNGTREEEGVLGTADGTQGILGKEK